MEIDNLNQMLSKSKEECNILSNRYSKLKDNTKYLKKVNRNTLR